MMPLAPVRLSITSGCFNRAVNSWLAARMITSVTLPAAIGTMTRIGLTGYDDCACDDDAASESSAAIERINTIAITNQARRVQDDRRAGARAASGICAQLP